MKARELEPNDPAILAHFAVLKQMQARDAKKTGAFFKNMFAALATEKDATTTATSANDITSDTTTTATMPPPSEGERAQSTASTSTVSVMGSTAGSGGTTTDAELEETNVKVE